ncbi:MAG TPA: DUF3299 domain-containing protein, partial [Steroidobacteraceae bacterium]|nr:DUF3299 domain-containing protein [Steroidobacteraceae bacterium]
TSRIRKAFTMLPAVPCLTLNKLQRRTCRYSAVPRPAVLLMILGFVLSSPAVSPAAPAANPLARPTPPKINGVTTLDWEDLLPENEQFAFNADPAPIHNYLGEAAPAAKQSGSSVTVSRFNGEVVKVPGFVVPLTITPDGVVSEFFLVPYYGACIHVPPPPPNQIIYVKMARGFQLKSIYDALWITGVLHTDSMTSRMATAAYSLAGQKVERYVY